MSSSTDSFRRSPLAGYVSRRLLRPSDARSRRSCIGSNRASCSPCRSSPASVADYELNLVSKGMDSLPTPDQKETQYAAISGPPMNTTLVAWSRKAKFGEFAHTYRGETGLEGEV